MTSTYKKRAYLTDVNKRVTEVITGKLKDGQLPWLSPYRSSDYTEFTSFFKDESFKGLNKVLLWIAKQEHQLQSNAFLTFNQASEIAGIPPEKVADTRDPKKPDVTLKSINHPLAGQISVGFIVYNSPKFTYVEKDGTTKTWSKKGSNGKVRKFPTSSEIKEQSIKKEWTTRSYKVWSLDQMAYLPEKWLERRNDVVTEKEVADPSNEVKIKQAVQSLIKKNSIKVVTGEKPHYDVSRDVIVMPKINEFVSDSSFYRALLHQVVHWTGGNGRLNRVSNNNPMAEDVAKEELVAELGTAFMCQKLGIDSFASSNLEHHDAMINPWIKLMEDDSKAITFAASRAEKSMNFLVKSLEREVKIEPTEENVLNP